MARCNRILAHNSATEPHRGSLAAASSSEHFGGCLVCLSLGVMQAGRSAGAIQLVDPAAVFAAVDRSIVWIWHIGYVLMFRWTESGCPQREAKSVGNTKVSLHVPHHRANRSNCLTQTIRRYAKLLAPVTEFVVLVDVDPAVVSRSGLGQVVWHGLLLCSGYRPSLFEK